ncbi:hypothetical protein F511_15222 [Dorcoceras hygrometricum]|uniref:Uncharacterized protein n=1 Tax=Dorcoceras hygrometricum TaxID=472368 RepID=A0A2Z7D281_9LAMI|nr:hypothetical protein F511_15222 [Dorcoceras hygrometricum]
MVIDYFAFSLFSSLSSFLLHIFFVSSARISKASGLMLSLDTISQPLRSFCKVSNIVSLLSFLVHRFSFGNCVDRSDLIGDRSYDEATTNGGILIPVVDLINENLPPPTLKCRIPCESGRSQAPRRQQADHLLADPLSADRLSADLL